MQNPLEQREANPGQLSTLVRSQDPGVSTAPCGPLPSFEKGVHMAKYRKFWVYSIACIVVWIVQLAFVAAKGNHKVTRDILSIFGGWCIAWALATIARFAYPPPKRWLQFNSSAT